MGMAGYTKLFSTILASTIWRAPDKTRILWITMLAMSDKNGIVDASIPGLADMARMTVIECLGALSTLHAPDEYSRTKDHEGRRVATIDGGWQILNHAKYRSKMNADERREYLRVKKAEGRAKKRQQSVNTCPGTSTRSTHADAEASAVQPPEEPATPAAPVVSEKKDVKPTSPEAIAISRLFNRRETTAWAVKEIDAFKSGMHRGAINLESIAEIAAYYASERSKGGSGIHRRDLLTFLNNFDGELDRANAFKTNPKAHERPNPNQRGDSPRNVGHNANLDYSKRTPKETAGAYPGLKETLDAVFRGVPPEGQPKPPESAG